VLGGAENPGNIGQTLIAKILPLFGRQNDGLCINDGLYMDLHSSKLT
jgi:hypothetical protein